MKITVEEPRAELVIKTAGRTFYAGLKKNKTAAEFTKELSPCKIELKLNGEGAFKTALTELQLPSADENIECDTGDVVYGSGGTLTFCFAAAKLNGVKLAHFYEGRAEELYNELQADPCVSLSLEWSE